MSSSKKPPLRNWDRLPDAPNCVTIFGAGIAGLSAAHELVERGFQVQIWERQGHQRHPEKGCDVGGLARTQWSAVSWPTTRDVNALPNQRLPFAARKTRPIAHIRQPMYLKWSAGSFASMSERSSRPLADVLDAMTNLGNGEWSDLSLRCYLDATLLAELQKELLPFDALVEALNRAGNLTRTSAREETEQGLRFEATRPAYDGATKDQIKVEVTVEATPNSDWPMLIVEAAVCDSATGEASEAHLWPIPNTPGQRASAPSHTAPSSWSEVVEALLHNHFDTIRPVPLDQFLMNGIDTARTTYSGEHSRGLTELPKCVVKVYDTSVASLTARDFEQRGELRIRQLCALLEQSGTHTVHFTRRPTFGAMEFSYHVVVDADLRPFAFTLELHLLDSRRPDWADISVQWENQPAVHVRRFWNPKLEQVYVAEAPLEPSFGRRLAHPVRTESGKVALASLVKRLGEVASQAEVIYVEVTSRQVGELSEAEKARRVRLVRRMLRQEARKQAEEAKKQAEEARKLAQAAQPRTKGNKPIEEKPVTHSWLEQLRFQWIDAFPYNASDKLEDDVETVVTFRARERWLPGEHGYRFFPSFYHHLFDTMKRTPLLDVEEKPAAVSAQERSVGIPRPEPVQYTESGRTAFDNLHPTSSYVLAFSKAQRTSQLSRFPIVSFEEVREYLKIVFGPREQGGFGFGPRDAARLVLKTLQFATACEQRRQEYETMSWWDFLDGDAFSPDAQYLLQRLPEALVAMNAKESDARTQWVPFIQLLLDQVRTDQYRDGTLRGPTTEAWLIPWRRYLEAQGVEFISGELEGFEITEVDGESRLYPVVSCFDPRYSADLTQPPLLAGYFVLAVSAEEARRLGTEYATLRAAAEQPGSSARDWAHKDDSDLLQLAQLGGDMTLAELDQELREPRPNSDFRHFAGIQYYFAEDVYWIDGHVYYPDSEWAITSISQARFWLDKMDWEHGYRGVLSAIVGSWDVESRVLKKTAWECTEAELAEEVWRQIRDGVQALNSRRSDGVGRFARRTPLASGPPEPLHWHLDQGVSLETDAKGKPKGYRNRTPFMIATPGRFAERPGSLERGHTIEHGFVLAGYYTQTHTRVPSMEAANESARHAVNAILRHLETKAAPGHQFRRAYCDIWNPEDRELDDLKFLKELDENLCSRGKPHVLEILDLDELARNLLRGGAGDPLDPLRFLSRLTRMYQDR